MKTTKLKKIFAITFSAVSITAVIIANNRSNKNIPTAGTHTVTTETTASTATFLQVEKQP